MCEFDVLTFWAKGLAMDFAVQSTSVPFVCVCVCVFFFFFFDEGLTLKMSAQ